MLHFAIIAFLVANAPAARAYSFMAGGCGGGAPAVGGPHLVAPSVINGTLASGSITVSLNGQTLNPGTATPFVINQDHVLTLQDVNDYKGILFRLGGAGTSALAPQSGDALLQVSPLCTPLQVSGVTHTSSVAKKQSSIILRVGAVASNLPLDVTVVVRSNTVSEFYYSQFILNAVASTPPTATPIAPTAKPVAPTTTPVAPTSKPVAPTAAPVAPTPKPVAPTAAPVTPTPKPVTPTVAPVAPTVALTAAPIVPIVKPTTPTAAPIAPTSKPITPTSAPANPPTPPPVQMTPTPVAQVATPVAAPSPAPIVLPAPAPVAPPVPAPIMPTIKPVAAAIGLRTPAPEQNLPLPTRATPTESEPVEPTVYPNFFRIKGKHQKKISGKTKAASNNGHGGSGGSIYGD